MKVRRKKPRKRVHKAQPTPSPERTLEAAPLESGGIPGPLAEHSGWRSIVRDEHRRTFVGHRTGAFPPELLRSWWHQLATRITWRKPSNGGELIFPRSAAWLTQEACRCQYRYSGLAFDPLPMEPWFNEIMDTVCRAVGLKDRPNSCNANFYDGGLQSVGWHCDDEVLFDAVSRDVLIVSLSLGATRSFELHSKDKPGNVVKLPLEDGDLCTMEGLCQKHYRHRVPRQKNIEGPRINLTWRWVVRHESGCPLR